MRQEASLPTPSDTAQLALIEAYLGETIPPQAPDVARVDLPEHREAVLLQQAMRVLASLTGDLAPMTLDAQERAAIVDALEQANYVQKDAAKALGISERVMSYKIKGFKITWRGRRLQPLRVVA